MGELPAVKVSPADMSDLMRLTMNIPVRQVLITHPEIMSNGQPPSADEPPAPASLETWRERPPLL